MSAIRVPKDSIIKDLFLNLIDKAVALWKKMDVRTSSGAKLEFLSFLYERDFFEKVKELAEFEILCDNLRHEITYIDNYILPEEFINKALRDYLLVAGRRDQDSEDFYEEPAGKDEAIRLLLEDVYIQIPPNRGIVWISGILPQKTVIELNERTRIRRATRFELRAMEQDSERYWGWEIPEKALLPLQLPAVQSAYMIEVKVNQDSSPALLDFLEYPRKPLDTKIVESLLISFRLLWDAPFSIDSSYFLIQDRSVRKGHIRNEFRQGTRLMNLIDGDEDTQYRDRQQLVFDSDEQKHLTTFWNNYLEFSDSPRASIHTDFERAILRFNQSYTEPYLEDVALDLALALETITHTSGKPLSYLAAMLASPSSDISTIQERISKFNGLRNRVAHGTTLSIVDTNLVKNIEEIVRMCLRNIVHLHPHIIKRNHDLVSILNESLLNCETRSEIIDKIPEWSRKLE